MKKTSNKISFTINGTHEGPEKNPLPKLKMIGRQQWTDKAQRYAAWKRWVSAAYLGEIAKRGVDKRLYAAAVLIKKPIVLAPDAKATMRIMIIWSSRAHADPENVFGSIADALFENDKHLAGSFDYQYSADKKAYVLVEIDMP